MDGLTKEEEIVFEVILAKKKAARAKQDTGNKPPTTKHRTRLGLKFTFVLFILCCVTMYDFFITIEIIAPPQVDTVGWYIQVAMDLVYDGLSKLIQSF
jgi:hypothetical protein